MLFGWLSVGGQLQTPPALFCPSKSNPKCDFDAGEPWPPTGAVPAANIRAGYGGRPEVEMPR